MTSFSFNLVPGWPKSIECQACHLPWNDPVVCAPCQHIICRGCVQNKRCGQCQRPNSEPPLIPTPIISNMAAQVLLRCTRCGWQGPRFVSTSHACNPPVAGAAAATPHAAEFGPGGLPPPAPLLQHHHQQNHQQHPGAITTPFGAFQPFPLQHDHFSPASGTPVSASELDAIRAHANMAMHFEPPPPAPVIDFGDHAFVLGCPLPYQQQQQQNRGDILQGIPIGFQSHHHHHSSTTGSTNEDGTDRLKRNTGAYIIRVAGKAKPWQDYNMSRQEFRALQIAFAEEVLPTLVLNTHDTDSINERALQQRASRAQVLKVMRKMRYAQNDREAEVMFELMDPMANPTSGLETELSFEQLATWLKFNKPARRKESLVVAKKMMVAQQQQQQQNTPASPASSNHPDDDANEPPVKHWGYFGDTRAVPTLQNLLLGFSAADIPTLTPGQAPCSDVAALKDLPDISSFGSTEKGLGVAGVGGVADISSLGGGGALPTIGGVGGGLGLPSFSEITKQYGGGGNSAF